ncbi:LytTR family DNA-binding domain-containing protein [Clostridium sp. AF15-41]|mgnify:FL=1|uniref:LytR/AlgR family response regulator transcription factor n=1 Tax=Clostridium sp. AF15-41 TaxID=2292996 RepID=UPI0014029013|nr:LytTR family DNA-binding domain-containing protein [Clostridium sp. AF15-41]
MNIVICDDERKVIEDVGSICREYLSPDVKLYGFRSAESLLKNLDKIDGDIDLFILDIEMPGRDGLWLRKELERYRYGSSIIYLTSHDELVQEAFGRYVIGFVDKVSFLNDKNKLVDKLKLFEQETKADETIRVKYDQKVLFIQKRKIILIEAEHVYSNLEYVIDEKINGSFVTERKLIRKSLKEWEDELGNNFIRISKRYIINLDYVQRINQDIVLKNGKELKIPKVNQKKCRDSYYNYCNRKMKWE